MTSKCQKCNSFRLASVDGKPSDLCSVSLFDEDNYGNVPTDMNIGGGDYLSFELCLDCGQIQGNWPVPITLLETTLPHAACVIIHNTEGFVYAASRKSDCKMWGLPGGKVDDEDGLTDIDPDEFASTKDLLAAYIEVARTAAVREVREETGLIIDPMDLDHVLTAVCAGEQNYLTHTFAYRYTVDAELVGEEDDVIINLLKWSDLTNPESSPFAEYNQLVVDQL